MKQQIAEFDDVTTDDHLDFGVSPDATFKYGQLSDTYNIADWFSRPIPIKAINWTQGTTLDQVIYPWRDYFTNPKIVEKLHGYSRLRCNLNVKLMINGTPFAYSLGMMSYRPLAGDPDIPDSAFSGGEINTSLLFDYNLVPLSQRPHVFFNPQDQRGCSMKLPFIKQNNWITLRTGSAPGVLAAMGSLSLVSFAPLFLSNGTAGQSVEVSVYAWASEVELAGPGVNFQSGKGDEFGTTPVSDIATSVAAATGALSSAPVIGNYAKATSMVANTVSGIAKALGYSKPPNIEPVAPYKYNTNPSVSNASVPVPMDVLAIDPKAELTIDPSTVCGPTVDETAISTIVQRDSYWFGAFWPVGAATGTKLLSFSVTPENFVFSTLTGAHGGTYEAVNMTPLAHVTQPFAYWQGDLIYTFKFVCSKYHRGRVRIFWDPDDTDIPFDSALNLNEIVDLGSTTTFEMRVPYMKETAWAMVGHLPLGGHFGTLKRHYAVGAAGYDGPRSACSNGRIMMDVLNELSAPDLSADVKVLVFVRAADNFSLAQPRGVQPSAGNRVCYADLAQYQSGNGSEFESGNKDEPDGTHEMTNSLSMTVPKMDPHVYMGEKVSSLRQLFKRTCYYNCVYAETPTENADFRTISIQPRFPRQPGPDPAAMNFCAISGVGNKPFNFCNFTYLTWFTPCYVGWRGSVVWRSQVNPGNDTLHRPNSFSVNISRSPYVTYYTDGFGGNITGLQVTTRPVLGATSSEPSYFFSNGNRAANNSDDFLSGTACAVPENEPVNIANVPMYSYNRMHPANPQLLSVPWLLTSEAPVCYDTDYVRDNVAFSVWSHGYPDPNTSCSIGMHQYVSGGEDFTPFVYLNAPTIYVTDTDFAPTEDKGLDQGAISFWY